MTNKKVTTEEAYQIVNEAIRSSLDKNHGEWVQIKSALLDAQDTYGKSDLEKMRKEMLAEWTRSKASQNVTDSRAEAELIACIRKKGDLQPFERDQKVAEKVLQVLKSRGILYHDKTDAYVFLTSEKRLVRLFHEEKDCRLLLHEFGINITEPLAKYVVSHIWAEAFREGIPLETRRFSYFDARTYTLYISNHADQVYRISPTSIELVDNGTDGAIFLNEPNAEPFSMLEGNPSEESLLDKHLLADINFEESTISAQTGRSLILFWFLSIFFSSIMPTKIILAFLGPKGSRKSSTLRKLGLLLFGSKFNVTPLTSKEDDFDAALTNSSFFVVDNADTHVPWLPDKLAVAATGAEIKRRQLYTTNTMVGYPVQCNLGITSRTPKFKRDDVNERLLPIKVTRVPGGFMPEQGVRDSVLLHRNEIMTEVLPYLQEVVRALEANKGTHEIVNFRMADFADFAIKIGRYCEVEDGVREIFARLSADQMNMTLEDNIIVDLLDAWVDENKETPVTTAELHEAFQRIARKKEFTYTCKNPSSLGQILKNQIEELRIDFDIIKRETGGRKSLWKITRKKEGSCE